MSELDEVLSRLQAHEGVEHLFLLGGDGLLVRHLGTREEVEIDTISAMVPGLGAACTSLGKAGGLGRMQTAVIEYDSGVAIVATLSSDLLLALILRPDVGFATLLRDLRRERVVLARLL